MAYEQRDNSGSLFKNDRKEKDTHADYRGDGMVNGQLVWINSWVKTASNGKPFMSMTFQAKEQQAAKPVAKAAPELDDDMPF